MKITIYSCQNPAHVLHEGSADSVGDFVWHLVGLGKDLGNADLAGIDLGKRNLKKAKFQGADLRGANFRGANLFQADFRGANLRGADMDRADLEKANLTGVDLTYVGFATTQGNLADILDHCSADEVEAVSLALCNGKIDQGFFSILAKKRGCDLFDLPRFSDAWANLDGPVADFFRTIELGHSAYTRPVYSPLAALALWWIQNWERRKALKASAV